MEQLTLEALDLGPLLHPGLPLPHLPLLEVKALLPREGGLQILQSQEQVHKVDPLRLSQQRCDILELQCSHLDMPWHWEEKPVPP